MEEVMQKEMDVNSLIKERINLIQKGIVPEGYMETKIGIVPLDWRVTNLRDVSNGTGKYGINARAVEYNKELPTYLRITDISDDGKFVKENKKSVNHKSSKDYLLNKNDIVFARTGNTTGKTYLYRENDGELVYAGFLIKYSINEKVVNPNIVFYHTQTNRYWNWVKIMSARSGQPGINSEEYNQLQIPVGPKNEQQTIADILSTWDRAIELKESLIKEKEEQKKGIMQKLLKPKVSWEEMRLGDLSTIVTGTTPPTSVNEYYDGEYPWVTPTDIKRDKYLYTSERTLTEEGMEKGRFVPKDSLLITCIASIGKNAILKKDGSCNQQINAIYPSETHSNEFLYYLITHNTNKLLSYAATTATAIINKQTFKNISFSIPSLREQQSIAETLSTADKEISLLKQELDLLKEQKKGLMQLLLTGIVRVGEVE